MSTKQIFTSSRKSLVLLLLVQAYLSTPSFATTSKTITTIKTTDKHPSSRALTSVERGHTAHRSSIGVATLHLYDKGADLKSNSLIRHLLRSAVGADSPDSNPDVADRTAANLNLDINETLAANLFRQHKFDADELIDIDKDNLVLGNLTRDNAFHLSKGNALFAPKKDIVILTDFAKINIAGGSLVGVLRPNENLVSIYDLEDAGSKKVSISVDGETINLAPGKNIILSKDENDFEKLTPARRIGYRKLEHKTLKSGLHVYTSEFSISSAVLHVRPLQNILLSSDPEDHKIATRLLKNYVILEDIYSNAEPYKMPASIVTPVKISTK